jgi:hypothetical protein
MRPYENRKFIEFPDMADLLMDGRGHVRNRESRRVTRRNIKRADKAKSLARIALEENVPCRLL